LNINYSASDDGSQSGTVDQHTINFEGPSLVPTTNEMANRQILHSVPAAAMRHSTPLRGKRIQERDPLEVAPEMSNSQASIGEKKKKSNVSNISRWKRKYDEIVNESIPEDDAERVKKIKTCGQLMAEIVASEEKGAASFASLREKHEKLIKSSGVTINKLNEVLGQQFTLVEGLRIDVARLEAINERQRKDNERQEKDIERLSAKVREMEEEKLANARLVIKPSEGRDVVNGIMNNFNSENGDIDLSQIQSSGESESEAEQE
jgi:hypothetical protein